MTSPQSPQAHFSRAGAMDLSSLVNKQQSPPASAAGGGARGGAGAPGRYVLDVTEAEFDAVMQRSLQHVIVIEFHSPRVTGGEQLSATLTQLADAADGRWLLVRIDVDSEQRIAQALGIQAVPTVVGVVGGQLAPLFQGVLPPEQVSQYMDELMNAAVANGVTGRAEPVAGAADATDADDDPDAEEPRDPRFAAADAAVDSGDYALAREEFDRLVQANPKDAEAITGRAAVGLLARVSVLDGDATMAAASAAPTDVDAQLAAADVELVSGTPDKAFDRLIALIRTTTGAERDTVRLRLLELFETQPPEDQTVLKARRNLMAALF
ncbi:co-chaperone YbbN [Propionibacteriaceae bacterium Y2011]